MYKATVNLTDDQPVDEELLLRPGKNLINGSKEFVREFDEITSLELDLLNVASSIFACDLAFKRGERENIARQITLNIQVVNYASFEAIREELRYILFVLSHDVWNIHFMPANGVPEENRLWPQETSETLLLFSGGLDSFAAAIDLGEQMIDVELVSHITANPVVRGTQAELFSYLENQYPGQFHRTPFRVSARKINEFRFPSGSAREESQRTRSFLFLTLAGIVARRRGIRKVVYIAENGQMAIHLPLTAARIGAFSTYTAHPEFLNRMQTSLSKILRYSISINNPYLYLTKAEAVKNTVNHHSKIVGSTVSCWRASRVRGNLYHCGVCIPCIIRRIGLEYNGLSLPEYREDLFNNDIANLLPDDEGKRNIAELGEFVKLFETVKFQTELEGLYPELVNPYFNTEQVIEMYKRFAVEARTVLNRYPYLRGFLK